MLKPFERGERVELRKSAIRSGIGGRADVGRRGSVVSAGDNGTVRVIWDGRLSPDTYAREFLRRVRGGSVPK